MAFRGRSTRFSRRRGRRSFRSAPTRRQKLWVDRTYFQVLQPNTDLDPLGGSFIDFFALVEEPEYTNADSTATNRQDECSVLRSLGRFELDTNVATDQFGGQSVIAWSAVILRIGSEELENTFVNDPTDIDWLDPARRAKMDILQFWPLKSWFQYISFGNDVGDPEFGTIFTTYGEHFLEWDVRFARKMTTEQELYLGIRCEMSGGVEPRQISTIMTARTLIGD